MQSHLIRIARSLGDERHVPVTVDQLVDLHLTRREGGTGARLPVPTLAAYVLCTSLPAELPFGHDCSHGPGPHRIQVLVSEATDETLRDRLRAVAVSRSAMLRRRRRLGADQRVTLRAA